MVEKKKIAIVSVIASFSLVVFKLVVGILTGSLSIISEALDSGIDSVASVITFFAVHISDKPANRTYNYGHGKVENLSAFIETLLLLITAGFIIYHSIYNLVNNHYDVEITKWSFIVIIVSIIVDYSRTKKMKKVAKETNSQALEADAANFTADMISCFFVLIGLIFTYFGYPKADSIAALIVAGFILNIAYTMGKKSVNVLLDKAPEVEVDIVTKFLKKNNVKYHSLKMRNSGADTFVKVNLHLDPNTSLEEAHNQSLIIENGIKTLIPRCIICIDIEPDCKAHTDSEKIEYFD